MEKQRIAIITERHKVAESIRRDILFVFQDTVEIIEYRYEDLSHLERLDADAVLVTRRANDGDAHRKVDDPSKIFVVRRTLWETELMRILGLPSNTYALVVNDTPQTTQEFFNLLLELKVDNVRLIPYVRGQDYPRAAVAITPGEASSVPPEISTVIDVGNRHLDISTFLDIIYSLKIDLSRISQALLKYMSLTVSRNVGIKEQFKQAAVQNAQMSSVIHHMDQGVMLTLDSGKIILCNEYLEQLAGHEVQKGLTTVQDLFGPKLSRELEKIVNEIRTMNIYGREYVIKQNRFLCDGGTYQNIYFFSDVTYVRRLEESVQKRARNCGFVAKYQFSDVRYRSSVMEECVNRLKIFAKSDQTVLLQGESGTGKELLAQSIHNHSPRRKNPFVAFNCAAFPANLLESELFGYERGAFTGARREGKPGLFEQANGGTIFLDEIGDMPAELQTRLLRVLQEAQVMRIGGDSVTQVDVRVIAATNQNLKDMMEQGKFRRDLYYRLNVLPVRVPPLRSRKEDIIPLFEWFTGELVPSKIADALVAYDWPGNVRELQNAASYYLMMKHAPNPLPDYVMCSEKSTEVLPQQHPSPVQVLSVLANVGTGMGRSKLREEIEKQYRISEYELRQILNELEQRGLIHKQLGRGGTVVTEAGRKYLDENKEK